MSSEGRLGERKLRRIREQTGINAVAGWAWTIYWEFRDPNDQHYFYYPKTGLVEAAARPIHYTSCGQ